MVSKFAMSWLSIDADIVYAVTKFVISGHRLGIRHVLTIASKFACPGYLGIDADTGHSL